MIALPLIYREPGSWGEGLILRAAHLLEGRIGAVSDYILLMVAIVGLEILAGSVTSTPSHRRYLMLTAGAFALFALVSPFMWERYNEPVASVLALWLIPLLDKRPLLQWAWLVVQSVITVGYLVWKIG